MYRNSRIILKHKFNAIRSEADGIRFDSKAERNYYLQLKARQEKGEILFFLRQVPFHLPGGVKYVLDFLIFHADGNITFEDKKGLKTPMYLLKKKQVESLYPVTITEV